MALKQKLKSERGNLNVGIKDMFMTMDPPNFHLSIHELAELRDSDKHGFNQVLEKFEQHKMYRLPKGSITDIIKKRIIRDENLNELLSVLLCSYWHCQDKYDSGYFWRMMPTQKEDESDAQYKIRRKRMEDNLMQVMLDVLEDCDYYIKGTQNSQKTQK